MIIYLDAKKTINTGSSRIDPNGEMKERKKQWRLSETHLTEVSLLIKGSLSKYIIISRNRLNFRGIN